VFYRNFGATVEEVNGAVAAILTANDLTAWDDLMELFFDRGAFSKGALGRDAAQEMLRTFGGEIIVHGHTPIPYLSGQDARTAVEPVVYADGLCIDVDGGIYMGGPGFVIRLDESNRVTTIPASH
jgi:hypothetical protein